MLPRLLGLLRGGALQHDFALVGVIGTLSVTPSLAIEAGGGLNRLACGVRSWANAERALSISAASGS